MHNNLPKNSSLAAQSRSKRKQAHSVDLDADSSEEEEVKVTKNIVKQLAKQDARNMEKCINHQRVLIFATRGIVDRHRHLMNDLIDLLPHSKKDSKLDTKKQLTAAMEMCELKNCNNGILFETRKYKDLYMWVSRVPLGPSVKFLVENIHTMAEVKLTGNCLKGSRPLLYFDPHFDRSQPFMLMKNLLISAFGTPKGDRKAKPFIDHVFCFFYGDGRIWFRNYQIVYEIEEKADKDPVLVEIGPRFVLNPIRIFNDSFHGATLWENPEYVSPNELRRGALEALGDRYDSRVQALKKRKLRKSAAEPPLTDFDGVFDE